jgi:hypothetical protein
MSQNQITGILVCAVEESGLVSSPQNSKWSGRFEGIRIQSAFRGDVDIDSGRGRLAATSALESLELVQRPIE